MNCTVFRYDRTMSSTVDNSSAYDINRYWSTSGMTLLISVTICFILIVFSCFFSSHFCWLRFAINAESIEEGVHQTWQSTSCQWTHELTRKNQNWFTFGCIEKLISFWPQKNIVCKVRSEWKFLFRRDRVRTTVKERKVKDIELWRWTITFDFISILRFHWSHDQQTYRVANNVVFWPNFSLLLFLCPSQSLSPSHSITFDRFHFLFA